MSNNTNEKLFTSGEIAEACGVTVRTVQYYDEKRLLSPTTRSEGGRRLYDSAALEKMRTICLLKALGLSLRAIRGVLESGGNQEVLRCLLEEQEKELAVKMEEQKAMQKALRAELMKLEGEPSVSVVEGEEESDVGMDGAMRRIFADKGTALYGMQRRMLVEGIVIDIVELACIVFGFVTGNWWPLLAILPLIVIILMELLREYYRLARYVCPHCHGTFQPSKREFMFSNHTPKTRKVTCAHCGVKDWCAEIDAKCIDS